MNTSLPFLTAICCTLFSCTATVAVQEKDVPISLAYHEAKEEQAPLLSTLVSNIDYIALETIDATLGDYFYLTLLDEYIIADTSTGCHLFNLKNGKYIRTIGMIGDQSPMGYSTCTAPPYAVKNEILLKGFDKKFKIFSINEGKLLKTLPGEEDLKSDLMYDVIFPLNDSTMLLYSNNLLGVNKYNLQVRTYEGHILKEFPSTNCFQKKQNILCKMANEGEFYSYNNDVYMHEFTSDTIFQIDKELNLHPYYILDLKGALPAPDCREMNNWKSHYVMFGDIVETDRYLILERSSFYSYGCIYDKMLKKTIRINREKENNGFINDIDGVFPFWPQSRGRGTSSNKVWQMVSAESFLKYANSKNRKLFQKTIHEEDNPVVIIGTVKTEK